MRRIAGIVVLFVLTGFRCVLAQPDSTYLSEVRIYGLPVSSYAVGAKVDVLQTGSVGMLSDQLNGLSSLYIKSYGNNQLATIALRGTTASQTAVLWNGININSPTLGQSDMSLLSLYLFDELSLRYGGSSALYGSDAIGGSVLLGQRQPVFARQVSVAFDQQFASFGRFDTGLKVRWGGDRWQFVTKAIRSSLENDFPYTSPAVGFKKRQNNAQVSNVGIDQQIQYRINSRQYVAIEAMYTDNSRQVQPPVTNNDAKQRLDDRNTRLSLNYHNATSLGVLTATAAYVVNDEDYIDGTTSTNRSSQLVTQFGFDHDVGMRLNVRYGLSYAQYRATSSNFDDNLLEHRVDAFASARYLLLPRWMLNMNLRQAVYDKRYAPFAPSVGTTYGIVDRTGEKLVIRMQGSRSYRVPTLNDRYWIPGGNPSLRSEDAWQVETGLSWEKRSERFSVESDVSAYHGSVDQMILWRPAGSYWTPSNLQRVELQGIECSMKVSQKLAALTISPQVQYSYTRSLNEKPFDADLSTLRKQLPYVPLHSARANLEVKYRDWCASLNANYTGRRYSTLDNSPVYALGAFALFDAGITRSIAWKQVAMSLAVEVRNVLDIYYETLLNHAMPGRNFSVRLNLKWNNNKTI